jgi:nucleotide-binding universal stress UspA family protein
MFKRILVPLDGSPLAEEALPVAARLARASQGSIVLLEVVTPPVYYGGFYTQVPLMTEEIVETSMSEAETYLAVLARSDDLAGIKIHKEIMYGTATQNILEVAHAQHVDLIVMCSHGRTGFTRWALGSVTHGVIHHCAVPVLVLREGHCDLQPPQAGPARPLCALVPLDGSPLAETALVPAANLVTALAAPAEGALHLTQVVKLFPKSAEEGFVSELNRETLERAETYLISVQEYLPETLPNLKLSTTWSVALDNDVAGALIGTAEQGESLESAQEKFTGCDLIAISTHGRSGLERWTMGSVTERILSATKLPVLVVRPPKVKVTELV